MTTYVALLLGSISNIPILDIVPSKLTVSIHNLISYKKHDLPRSFTIDLELGSAWRIDIIASGDWSDSIESNSRIDIAGYKIYFCTFFWDMCL